MAAPAAKERRDTNASSPLFRNACGGFLTSLVATLSIVTGIINIGSMGVSRPLAVYVPEIAARTARFTGTMTGFLMVVSVYGLRHGYRVAWSSTIVLLPVTAVQGLVQSSLLSFPLVAVSVLAMPAVLLNRRFFDRAVDLTMTQLASLAAVVAAATDRENIQKLRRAGADIVLSPAVLGGRLLVESAFGNDDPERVIDRILDIDAGDRSP